jgi:predicted anti-sigma-YlaC factor YlaD
MLSTFEAALLDRHLRRCADCRAFAAGAAAQTQLLRDAVLEQPLRPVTLPAARSRPVRRVALGALTTAAAMAAAAVFTLTPSGQQGQTSASRSPLTGAKVLVVVPAKPSLASEDTVPRLELASASVADGPLHGLFNTPVVRA